MKYLNLKTVALAALALALPLFAEDAVTAAPASAMGLNTVWVLLGAFLVFFMQAGFGMVEAGFIRAKNTCNILTKNFLDFCVASVGFFLVGYALMFGNGNGFIGWKGFCLAGLEETAAGVPLYAFWLFQAAFCGAAATIVAGGMAERMHFKAYILYTIIISAVVYPIIGHWVWGGGWLSGFGGEGFLDFAGSGVVHTTGGTAALIGTIMLGARRGKYSVDGSPRAINAHSIPLASLGVFILWFGWFGFNAGSTLGVSDGFTIGRVALNTNLAAAVGGITAIVLVTFRFGKPDLSMGMNGALAGLVSVTAPCAFIDPWAAAVIGGVGGVLVVFGVELLDKLRIDDPVGAFPVHGLGGIWGCVSCGLFAKAELAGTSVSGLLLSGSPTLLGIQIVGVLAIAGFTILSMGAVFKVIDLTVGLRVSEEDELRGLDITEHGMEAYGGFQVFSVN
ncbi:MAG: ammonium transporter [Phycisphaerae bacterium]